MFLSTFTRFLFVYLSKTVFLFPVFQVRNTVTTPSLWFVGSTNAFAPGIDLLCFTFHNLFYSVHDDSYCFNPARFELLTMKKTCSHIFFVWDQIFYKCSLEYYFMCTENLDCTHLGLAFFVSSRNNYGIIKQVVDCAVFL